jgi:transposase
VDLLPDREAGTLADWLRAHPGTQVICRDRAGAYADGARQGAPDAVQVADRWHLWHNLAEHAEKTVNRHRECIREPEPEPEPGPEPEEDPAGDAKALPALQQAAARRADDSPLARRTRQRWELVQALRAQGKGIKPITRETGPAKGTVRRFYRAATVDELLASARDGRPSQLDDHKQYLHQRWNAGCTSVRQLHAEIRQRGYPGSYSTLRDYLQPFRQLGAAPPPAPAPPKARDITRMLLSQPDSLDEDEKLKLKNARDRCPHVDALAGHVTAFAKILTGLHGGQLDDWITAVEADDQPDLHSFTLGIRRDYDAVKNGLTLQWSSGAVEGNVNRLILWNQICQISRASACRTTTIGRLTVPGGRSSCRGVGPAGVGMSASWPSSRSRAALPSSTAACSSSVSGIVARILCRFCFASRSCALLESFGA